MLKQAPRPESVGE